MARFGGSLERAAMRLGLLQLKTPRSRSSALLVSVTRWDHRRGLDFLAVLAGTETS